MRHLKIQQSNITELSNYKIIRKLHELIDNNELDNSSLLSGVISSNYVYDEDFNYFLNLYNNFQIIYNVDKIITFKDSAIEQLLLANNIGNTTYNFITYGDATDVLNIPASITSSNNNIISFDEFRFFTSITRVNPNQFQYNANLVSIKYPSSIISIDASAHSRNTSLTNIKIDNTNISKIGQGAFWGCTALTSIVLPSTCATLDSWAFNECSNLKSINLQNVITLKSYAFQNCTSLDIDISNDLSNVESIDTDAFINCTSLTGDLSLPNLTYIRGRVFGNCTKITSVSNLGSITIMDEVGMNGSGYGPFINCTGLISVVLPSTLTSIKRNSFSGCTSLKTITGGNNVTRLLGNVFNNCTSLETVGFDFGKIIELGNGCFYNCQKLNIETLSMPNLTGQLSAQAFGKCKNIKYVTDLGSITGMLSSYNANWSWGTFHDCTGLISVNLPSTCKSLDGRAFSGCTSLTTINLNNVTYFGEGCFMGCTSLASIDLTNCVLDGYAFNGCTALTSINLTNCTINGDSAFKGCKSLTSVDLTEINFNAGAIFSNCTSLGEGQTADVHIIGNNISNTFGWTKYKRLIVHGHNLASHNSYKYPIYEGMPLVEYIDMSDCNMGYYGDTYATPLLKTWIIPSSAKYLEYRFIYPNKTHLLYCIMLLEDPSNLLTENGGGGNELGLDTFKDGVTTIYVKDATVKQKYLTDTVFGPIFETYPDKIKTLSELPVGVWTTGLYKEYEPYLSHSNDPAYENLSY